MKRLSALRGCLAAVLSLFIGAASLEAAPGDLSDGNIRYFGRWDFGNSSQYLSYWGGSYLKVKFTGTTARIKLGNTTNYYAKIDSGPWVTYANATGTVNLTPTPLAAGTHTLSVAQGKDQSYTFNFQGLLFDAGAATSPPAVNEALIEFIGDSITAGYRNTQAEVSDHAWIVSENLGAEHTQIAYPGIALVSGYRTGSLANTGMDTQYFKLQSLGQSPPSNWNFAAYTPRTVVINLGTNDNTYGVPDNVFQSGYTTFLANVRTKFPAADVFVLRTFGGYKAAPTLAAVNARIAAGDWRVRYVDTTGWIASADYIDGTHPSDAGHIKAANLLRPLIAPSIRPEANAIYHLICQRSGKVVDNGGSVANGTTISQWQDLNPKTNQEWKLVDVGGGYFNLVCSTSGKVLDNGGSTTDGTPCVQQALQAGNINQHWKFVSVGNGYYHIVSRKSGKALDNGGSTTNGTPVNQWTDQGAANLNQNWMLRFIR